MIGQKALLDKINLYTIDTFPRSILITGEKGMGKHTLANYIKDNIIKLPLIDLTSTISDDVIDEIYRNPNPNIYLIDLSLMMEKSQNVLLKFVEEPLNNSFIILLAQDKNFVLNTILNRCISFDLAAYTKGELQSFLSVEEDQELILKILRSPGKILNTNIKNMKDIFDICDKIVTKLNISSYSNMLSIANKINFKDDFSKFDIDIFFDCLIYKLYCAYLETNNLITLKMYNFTIEKRKKLIDKRLNLELFFENYLTQLWKISKGA